jgi:serine protease
MTAKKRIRQQDNDPDRKNKLYNKPDYGTQIIVKFCDHIELPYYKGVEKQIEEFHVGPWKKLVANFPGVTIEPLFINIDPDKIRDLVSRARKMDPTYIGPNFLTYFRISCPVDADPDKLQSELNSWSNIERAYLASKTHAPATVDYTNYNYSVSPSCLDAGPAGIGSKEIWDLDTPGSDGSGISYIDIEKGWKLDHPDLASQAITLLASAGPDVTLESPHGTSVLGIISARDNEPGGCIGASPAAKCVNAVSSDSVGLSAAIMQSLLYLGFGDILLIETAVFGKKDLTDPADYSLPAETAEDIWMVIRLATALGIIAIEPGGDGNAGASVNLNDFIGTFKGSALHYLDSTNISEFRDSGAIIVTAGSHLVLGNNTHEILSYAPIGNRIDCYAWGDGIAAPTTDSTGTNNLYDTNFGGTSGAAAIIAGAILSIQGMAIARPGGFRVSPGQIRGILRNASYGTDLSAYVPLPFPSYSSYDIYMPDLKIIAQSALNVLPDIYMRDFPGDIGDPHSGSISMSPDIILKKASVVDYQNVYGEATPANINNIYLCDKATAGSDNYIYVRVKNRGGVTATNVTVRLYWGDPATLLTPSGLTLIGDIMVPDVPITNTLMVSNEFIWPAASVPPTGHYCFVGIAMCDLDPVVDLTYLQDWDWATYYRFIRENNNITWRNFNVEDPPPPPSPPPYPSPKPLPKKQWRKLPFVSPGLPGISKKMHLEITANLPKGSEAVIQIPFGWMNLVRPEMGFAIPEYWKHDLIRNNVIPIADNKGKTAFLPLNLNGKTTLKEVLFPADSVNKLNIFVAIPGEFPEPCTLYVCQILDGEEMGRITWRLPPDKKKPVFPRPAIKKRR